MTFYGELKLFWGKLSYFGELKVVYFMLQTVFLWRIQTFLWLIEIVLRIKYLFILGELKLVWESVLMGIPGILMVN